MSEAKPIRLFKAATDLNVSPQAIVELLRTKGFDLKGTPNDKLTSEQVDILYREYAQDKKLKEKASQVKEQFQETRNKGRDAGDGDSDSNLSPAQSATELKNLLKQQIPGSRPGSTLVITPAAGPKPEAPAQPVAPEPPKAVEVPVQAEAPKPEPPAKPKEEQAPKPEPVERVVEKVVEKAAEPIQATAPVQVSTPVQPPVEESRPVAQVLPPVAPPVATPDPVAPPTARVEEAPAQHTSSPIETEAPKLGGLKVVGFVDPEKLKPQPKPSYMPAKGKKPEPPRAKAPKPDAPQSSLFDSSAAAAATAQQNKPVAKAAVEQQAPIQEPTQEPQKSVVEETTTPIITSTAPPAQVAPEAPEAEQVLRAKDHTPKLSGLKIVGKIELPSARPPGTRKPDPNKPGGGRPGAHGTGSTDPNSESEEAKRKRKRKRKSTGVQGTMTQQTGQPGIGSASVRPKGPADKSKTARPGAKRDEPNQRDVSRNVSSTMGQLGRGASRARQRMRKDKRNVRHERFAREEQLRSEQENILEVTEFLTANELASLMDVNVNQIIGKCLQLGLFVSINQRLDSEVIQLIAEEFGYEVNFISAEDTFDQEEDEEEDDENLVPRAPIVTVMGHVDHGKTTLLDYIRRTNVASGEAGGITQHIGAYEVAMEGGRKITFLDTPGHEAFTAMRARGAKVTDVAIIVVAADDQVMPQTREAINHAQAAGVPMVFAINKIDKPGANSEKIKEQLSGMNLLVEDWGGKIQSQEISAKAGLNVSQLLEKVVLEAEILELKANPARLAKGTVIEAQLDKGRGVVATVLVQNGTLKVGDIIVANCFYGKVKALVDYTGKRLKEAGPSTPVQVLGFDGVPQAGDKFQVMESERDARELATKRQQLLREQSIRMKKHITLEEIARRSAQGEFHELNVIVKGDVDGSVEALADSLLKLSSNEAVVNIIMKGVGQITESDVLLASASNALVVGFQVRPSAQARKLAQQEQIDIRLYSIIYDAINEIKDALEGLLKPKIQEEITGTAEIRDVFKISKVGTIAGCRVTDGKIARNNPVRLIRDGVVIYNGKLSSLKRFKDDVREVADGFECGMGIENFNDLRVGDVIEGYTTVEVKRTLA